MTDPLARIAREVTDSVLPPVRLRIGGRYAHPTEGVVEITGGCYRDPVYGRISNFWHWTVLATGEPGHGYGDNWPEVEPTDFAYQPVDSSVPVPAIERHTEEITFRLSPRLCRELGRLVAREQTSVSEIVRDALARAWGLR